MCRSLLSLTLTERAKQLGVGAAAVSRLACVFAVGARADVARFDFSANNYYATDVVRGPDGNIWLSDGRSPSSGRRRGTESAAV
jgi:hypothetical protein